MSSSSSALLLSRCCTQLGLVRRFSNALSLSSPLVPSASSVKCGPKSFSKAAYGGSDAMIGASATTSSSPLVQTTTNANTNVDNMNNSRKSIVHRSMATSNRKVIDAKNAKRLKIQQKKKKNSTNANVGKNKSEHSEEDSNNNNNNNPFLQHEEWVRFQQSITVDGFQTGQTTTATVLKKSRGGKQARRKREKELARLGAAAASSSSSSEKISAVAQKFPAIRYSPEQTEDLLKQAYEALPVRDGKRGTRNLRRQETRWKTVRKIRSDYKAQQINAHFRKMEARKYKRDRTKHSLESAVDQRKDDLDYQGMVLKRWMDNTMGGEKQQQTSFDAASSDELA